MRSNFLTITSKIHVKLKAHQSPKALIFDMDGVLIDSEPLHKRAKELAFGEIGLVLPESVYDSYKGPSRCGGNSGNAR